MTTKNRNFVMLDKHNMNVIRGISFNPTAVDILLLVLAYMDSHNHVIATISYICKATKKSKPAVYAAIKLLKERNVLLVTNTGGTCIFICNASVAWTSYAGSREKHARLHGTVLMDGVDIPDQFGKLEPLIFAQKESR